METQDTVVVSGAGTGIGRAAAQRLAAAGFGVIAVGRRRQPLDQLATELGPQGGVVLGR
ncbi:MAG: SDR family NAD(P)-dependent oxidoreductase [Streptosporangiaceae bacterium]|nr:SDR family NAD(P)-dependent oxidoreductase [Streptosporangiaceae bacterium]